MRLHTVHLQIRQHAFAMYSESINIKIDTRPNPPLHHGWDGRKGMAILLFEMRWDSRSSPYEWAGHLPLEERRIAIPPFFQGGVTTLFFNAQGVILYIQIFIYTIHMKIIRNTFAKYPKIMNRILTHVPILRYILDGMATFPLKWNGWLASFSH